MEEISLVEPDGTLTWESPTSRRPLGYMPDSLVGHNLFDIFHPDERASAAQLLEQVVNHPGISKQALFRLRHQDGSWRWMEGVITNLMDEPAVQSVVINYRDVTERKQADEALRESQERYQALAVAAQDMIFVINRAGLVEYVNDFAASQFKLLPENILGRTALSFFPPETGQRQQANMQKVFDSGRPIYIEYLTRMADREIWLGTWLVPLKEN
jgi:PAS domain S-box-containing protein